MTEDVEKRYESYGFNVLKVDGYDWDQFEEVFSSARYEIERPTLIIAKTIIGKHCPNREGKSISHGNFLGPEEMSLFKKEIGWPEENPFYVPDDVKRYFQELLPQWIAGEKEWDKLHTELIGKNSEKAAEWEIYQNKKLPEDLENTLWNLNLEHDLATRKYNEVIVQVVANLLPYIVTGSADVASCDFTWIHGDEIVRKVDWKHQQIKFGVREFSMAAIATGMSLYGMVQPVVGTFLVFSDYMRNAIRMAALMRQKVIFVYSHDSIQIGQDGPTHQPIEHLMSLRLIPNLILLRPCDENESKSAWSTALQIENQPVALCFTRNPVKSTISDLTDMHARAGVRRGAYVLYGEPDTTVDVEIFSTGSEIHPSMGAAKKLENDGFRVRVISVPSWEMFETQDNTYKTLILNNDARLKVSVEAGVGLGWQRFVGNDGLIISQETYGASAPAEDVLDYFGFTSDKIYERIKKRLTQKNN
jgi:transketolase